MVPDVGLFILLLVAIAIGFYLGRRSRRRQSQETGENALSQGYFKGLNFILNEQADHAVDTFIEALEVNAETLDTHLALGNLLRRKGEVDRAIKVHQNLLARPGLNAHQLHQSQLELARDFIKAGLLDRAECLLRELVETSPEFKNTCLEHLVEIYRDEKEWEKAIHAVNLMVGRRFTKMPQQWGVVQAHFCCELAEEALENSDYLSARRHLKQALGYDRASVRASLVWGGMEYRLGHYREALKILVRISQQDPDYLPEAVDLICQCYESLGDTKGLYRYLMQALEDFPSNSLILKIADKICQRQDDVAAAGFIGKQLKQRPSIKGLSRLIELHLAHSQGAAQENLQLLKQLVDKLLIAKPAYRCQRCGFTGNHLHWLCPTCKSWGSVKAIQGVEGE